MHDKKLYGIDSKHEIKPCMPRVELGLAKTHTHLALTAGKTEYNGLLRVILSLQMIGNGKGGENKDFRQENEISGKNSGKKAISGKVQG